ncbi:GNAT family N-acetyltransferase [Alkalibacterium iburiense]|uniref:GNAT family N-acetyltransferase n=1 Tax=Alkalibacterium iburiense TaxID=290589 RepID=A0ABP3HK56_9LACT
MTIKYISSQKLGAYFDLQNYAFPADPAGNREERTDVIWDSIIPLGVYDEEGSLQSALIIRQYQAFMHGKKLPMGGIANVASYPEARGQGNIRELFKETLSIMRKEGMLLSYLSPFSYRFYRQYGYELAFEYREYRFTDFSFNFKPKKMKGTVERVKWKNEQDVIKQLYTQKYENAVGPVDREEWVWKENKLRSSDRTIAVYRNESGDPEGYIFYRFNDQGGLVFTIEELVALTGQAEKALWSFIASHDSQFDTFTFKTGAVNNLSHLFNEPRAEQQWVSGMMARIVDFEAFLKAYPFKEGANQSFVLEVENDFADWNNGVYTLNTDGHATEVKKGEGNPSDEKISADIQTWSQLFMGTRTSEDLYHQEKLHGKLETIKALEELIEKKQPELYDFF